MTDLGQWDPLRPEQLAELFDELRARWWLSGGWSLDLLVGRETRRHADIDVTILRPEIDLVRAHLSSWELHIADPPGSGRLRPWDVGSELAPELHDVWCRPGAQEPWRVQLMVNDVEAGEWVYRRDRRIRRPLETLAGRASTRAMAVLVPDVQLLYKSTHLRDKDHADFARVLPLLDGDERRWLQAALCLTAPGHPWIGPLSD
jgi:hypothetical protein